MPLKRQTRMTHLHSEIDVPSGSCQSFKIRSVHMTLSRSYFKKTTKTRIFLVMK